MNKVLAISANFQHSLRWLICIALFSSASAWAAKTEKVKIELSNNEETFVFAGTCPNGKPYRLFSYQKQIGSVSPSFYDYDGPAGKGTVQSDAAAKVMAVRICRELAEIINTNYWE